MGYDHVAIPAGPAFSIWGIIFTWEAVFVVAQFFHISDLAEVLPELSPWFCLTQLMQGLWVPLFTRSDPARVGSGGDVWLWVSTVQPWDYSERCLGFVGRRPVGQPSRAGLGVCRDNTFHSGGHSAVCDCVLGTVDYGLGRCSPFRFSKNVSSGGDLGSFVGLLLLAKTPLGC